MVRSYRSLLFFAVAGLVVLSGCRTYGGYDAGPKTFEAMQRTVRSFEDELDRAEADLQKLEKAAPKADTLQVLGHRFRELVEEHESLLDTQHRRVERLSPDATYRTLHQAYGATITEQRLIRQRYQRLITEVRTVVQGSVDRAPKRTGTRQYTVRPVGFPEQKPEQDLTIEEALRGL